MSPRWSSPPRRGGCRHFQHGRAPAACALEPAHERALAVTPADELLALPFLTDEAIPHSVRAYEFSKRANQIRVQAEAVAWGERGARVNSISPGVILTPLAQTELDGGVIAARLVSS